MASSSDVEVWIYDLSKGLARSMSKAFLGKQIDGIWHTAIVAYGQEYFFGGDSIECCSPGGTILGQPDSKVRLGKTEIPYELFHEHLRELSQTSFRPGDYHILHRNCNNFSSEVAQFLTGNDIPSHITSLPDEVMSTPFGQMIQPMLNSMTVNPGAGAHRVFGESKPSHRVVSTAQSSQSQPSIPAAAATSQHKSTECIRYISEQSSSVDDVCEKGSMDSQQLTLLTELLEYAHTENAMWSVSPAHVKLLGSLLVSSDDEKCTHIWRVFQKLVAKADAIPMVKRCDKSVFVDRLCLDQIESCKTLCNLCSIPEGYSLCLTSRRSLLEKLPISLSSCEDGDLLNCILSTTFNISVHHKLIDDLDIQFTCSLVEFLNSRAELESKTVVLCLKSLLNFMSRNMEVKMLAFTMGLDINKYRNKPKSSEHSESLTKVIDSLSKLEVS